MDEDRSVLVVGINGRVLGMEAETGTLVWEHPVGTAEVEILIHAGRVYATTGEAISCFDYRSGEPLFRVKIPGKFRGRSTMLVQDGKMFIATRGEVSCFDLDGKPLWHDGLGGRGLGGIALGFPGNIRQADERGDQ